MRPARDPRRVTAATMATLLALAVVAILVGESLTGTLTGGGVAMAALLGVCALLVIRDLARTRSVSQPPSESHVARSPLAIVLLLLGGIAAGSLAVAIIMSALDDDGAGDLVMRLRAEIVVALAVGLVVAVVPLLLWRNRR